MSPRRGFLLLIALMLVALSQATGSPLSIARAAEPPRAKGHDAWRIAMQKLRVPGKGCFKASYPSIQWKQVGCLPPSRKPFPPARGPRPFTVGNGNDFAGRVAGTISSAEGTFEGISGLTSETGLVNGTGAAQANAYSLQLNSQFFSTSACAPSPNPGCQGWVQFIYSSRSLGAVLIESWLLNYNTTCPSGWNTSGSSCFRNTVSTAVATQPISSLGSIRLTGSAAAGGNDTATLFFGSPVSSAAATNADSLVNLSAAWKDAEFTIVGDCCFAQANFNAGTTFTVRTTTHSGTRNAPTCVQEGFTGETNNLNLVGTASVGTGAAPAVVSTQSNSPGSASSCQAANGLGDTHLKTFNGLLYDFQATGDFILAQKPDFTVQTRQVSGAPTWPNASVNKAVGTRMGKTRIAVCLPNRVEINGKARAVPDGTHLVLAKGVDLGRFGNVYLMRGQHGDSVRAQVNNGWIDVTVGLGRWPDNVRGLLANVNGDVHKVATRSGTVLTMPLTFGDLYDVFGTSWRVKPSESLLCGKKVAPAPPTKPFYTRNLSPSVARRARAVCIKAGVKQGPYLEACTLDVAVIGRAQAAKVYVGLTPPVAVALPK